MNNLANNTVTWLELVIVIPPEELGRITGGHAIFASASGSVQRRDDPAFSRVPPKEKGKSIIARLTITNISP